jgi:hypothetical protein
MSDLLEELRAAGEVEAQGGFTIDPEKARQKLRQYQLADPHRYVLLLVEAAVSSGASKLEFEIDSDDLHLRFDGAVFRYEQLENIYGSLFAHSEDIEDIGPEDLVRLRGLQQLAFALNSAMALNPRFARVVSVDAEGKGTALQLHPDRPDEVERIEGHTPGNHVHVKDRFRPGLLVEFFRSMSDTLAEVLLLREHCRWSRTPVFVNGTLVSGPMELPQEHWTAVDVFDEGQRIGRAALGLCEDPSERIVELEHPWVYLLSNGVFIEPHNLDGKAVRGFGAIVDSSRFGKDVSQTKLVHDAGYEAVIGAVLAAQDATIRRLCERRLADTAPAWADEILREWLRLRFTHGLRRHELRRALDEDETFAAVAEVPLWPVIGAAPISTRALIESEGPIRHAGAGFDFAPLDVPFVLLSQPGRAQALLELLFGSRLQDYSAAMRREAERQRRRLEFMTRRQLPELSYGYDLIRETIRTVWGEGDERVTVRGELGLRVLGHQDSWVRLVCEGCLLEERALDGPVPGLCAVVQTSLTPNADYDEAQPNRALAVALVAILEALERAVTALASSGAAAVRQVELRNLLRIFVHAVCQRDYAAAFLRQFRFSRSEAKRELDRLDPQLRPAWGFDAAREDQHPLLFVPLYERCEGEPATLAELAARRAAGERLAWLEPVYTLPKLDTEVLLLEQPDREALRELFGSDALEPFAERLAWLRRREKFMSRPEARLGFSGATLCAVELGEVPEGTAGELRGALGLREFSLSAAGDGRTPVRVHYCARELCELDIQLPLPGLVAWVDSEQFELNPTFEGLAHPMSLRRPLLAGLVELVARELERLRSRPEDARRCEWWFVIMVPSVVLGAEALMPAVIELRRELGREAALHELDELLELLERFPARDLDRALGRLRGRQVLPRVAAVREQLRRPTRRPSEAALDLLYLRRQLAPQLDALLELPVFRRFEGPAVHAGAPRSVSLDELLVRVGAGEPISWVGDEFHLEAMPAVELEILALDAIEQRLLEALFGDAALELVSDWLIGRAQFERRRTISEIRMPRGSAIVTLAIEQADVRGELGISRQSPRELTRSKVRVFTESREVGVLDFPARPLAVVGALEFDDLELGANHDDLSPASRERVRSFVDGHHDALITALAQRYAELERRDKSRAAEIVRDLLVEWPPGTGGYQARANKRPTLFRHLAELPVFAGARKPWSALELAEAGERGGLATLEYRRPSLDLPELPVVILDADDVEGVLRSLFSNIRDLDEELEREREIAARKSAAPDMASAPPADAMASIQVAGEGLQGWLWLAEHEAEVMFGVDAKVVHTRVISALCWCAGAVWGGGLNIARDWSRVTTTRAQDRLLERLACKLWDQLIDDFERRSELAPRDPEERRALAERRNALHGLFMRLHEQYGRKRRRSSGKKKRKHKRKRGNRFERLYARVSALPVLQLSNGRWISAEVAERERPIELAGLALWTGPSAEELAHKRAVERREAERARERKREREREREAERRRAEAEAREREAARRRAAAALAERQAREQAERRAREAERRESEPAKPTPKERVEPRPPLPEELLLEALREELRLVRDANEGLVSNRILDSLVLGEARRRGPLFRHQDGRVEIDVGHPLFVATLDGYFDDQGVLTLLASATYSYLNIVHLEIEDRHEAEFLRLHAAYAATSLDESPS